MIKLLQNYNLRKYFLIYVKGEGFNLNTMIVALKLVARWEVVGLEENFKGTKNITWPKKSRKSRQKWNKTCFNYSLHPRKLNTLMKTCIF
jgi:hypothetical protein